MLFIGPGLGVFYECFGEALRYVDGGFVRALDNDHNADAGYPEGH